MERYIPRQVIVNTNLSTFQYKLLHNTLYLNEMLYKFGKIAFPLCFICMGVPESSIYLFHSCIKTNFPWMQLQHSFQNVLIILLITPQR